MRWVFSNINEPLYVSFCEVGGSEQHEASWGWLAPALMLHETQALER